MPKANLTIGRIDRFRPAAGKREDVLFDTVIPGFGVRCQASGRKSFLLQFRFNGHQRKMSLGDVRVVGLAAARSRAQQILGQVAAGIDPLESKREADRAGGRRLDRALEAFAKDQARRKVVKRNEVASLLRRELLNPIGPVDIAKLTRQDLVMRIAEVEETRPGAASALRSNLTAFLNFAVDAGLLSASPLAGWRKPKPTRAQRLEQTGRVLSDDEIVELWRGTTTNEVRPYYGFLWLLLLTGQRRQETVEMRWEDITERGGMAIWTIPAALAKNGIEHPVPLPPLALEIIKAQPRWSRTPYVFAGRNRNPMGHFSHNKAAFIERTGMRHFTLHDLRRTYRTGLSSLGVEERVAEAMLNHTRPGLIAVYNRDDMWEKRLQCAQMWADHIGNLVAAGGSS